MPDAAFYASLPRARGAACALLRDIEGRILLVKPTYKAGWFLPGGIIEAAESPLAACRRECAEELGFTPRLDGLLCVDWSPPAGEVDEANVFVFHGDVTSSEVAAIRLPAEELSDHAMAAPEQLADLVPPHVARRLEACLGILGPVPPAGPRRLPASPGEGAGVYLEDGRSPW
jgi:8-oxo-dGTP diphosphatase